MFNYNHLYYFYVVASSESLTTAAHQLKVSQPALSTQIKTLENRIGHDLFVRVGRKLELSNEGKLALAYCRRIFGAAEELSESLKLDSIFRSERLVFGVSDEIERPFGAEIASRVLQSRVSDQPLSVRMNSDDHYILSELLQRRGLDVLLTHLPAPHESLLTLAEVQMPVKAFVSSKLKKKVPTRARTPGGLDRTLEDLSLGLILPTVGQKLRSEAELYLQKMSYRAHLVFESNVMAGLSRAVVDGLGVGFFPLPYVATDVKLGRLIEVNSAPLWFHTLYLIGGSDCLKTPRIQNLRDSFLDICREYGCKIQLSA
jgi:LysR family transcriptional regulator, transcriptional activator of nhaA